MAEIPLAKARNLKRNRYNKTHPDSQKNARITFYRPNKYWQKHPDKCDVLGFDAKEAPKVRTLPDLGVKGQVVEFNGKMYVAGKNGKFNSVQKTF